jgi:hypothetical protein
MTKELPSAAADISPEKARKILHDGEVHGKPLTEQQRKFFGAIGGHLPAPGKKMKKAEGLASLGDVLEKAKGGWERGPRGGRRRRTAGGKWEYQKEQKGSDSSVTKDVGGGKITVREGVTGEWSAEFKTHSGKTLPVHVPGNHASSKSALASATKWFNSQARGKFEAAESQVQVSSPGKQIAVNMQQWHSSMGDPIYQASSTWVAGKEVPTDIAKKARDSLAALSREAAEEKHGWTKEDAKELKDMANAIDRTIRKNRDMKKAMDDGKPGESLQETDIKELKATYGDLQSRLKSKPDDKAMQGRLKAIKAELQRRGAMKGQKKEGMLMRKSEGLDALGDVLQKSSDDLKKSLLGYGSSWVEKLYGTPYEADALRICKDQIACGKKRDKIYADYRMPWHQAQALDPVKKAQRQKEKQKRMEAVDKEQDSISRRKDDLESKYIDYRIKQADERQSMTKSLEDDMSKSDMAPVADPDGMPKHNWGKLGHTKSAQIDGGSADGGSLDGTGKTSGPNPEQPVKGFNKDGKPTGMQGVKGQKLSEDDEEAEGQMKPHRKPLERSVKKSLHPADQREETAHEEAVHVSQLRKGQADVKVGENHPFSMDSVHGNTDKIAAGLVDPSFYNGRPPSLTHEDSLMRKSLLCKSCGDEHSAMLTACPSCGENTTNNRLLPNGAWTGAPGMVIEKAESHETTLKPIPQEEDLYFPGVEEE